MESVETLIYDDEDNHLVVVLNFYDEIQKSITFQIPTEYYELEIADISISKLDINQPIRIKAFFKMCNWLIEQMKIFENAVFSFICSTNQLHTNHSSLLSQQYRWFLFDALYRRKSRELEELDVRVKDIIVGENEYSTFARVFYRREHEFLINVVLAHLKDKYD